MRTPRVFVTEPVLAGSSIELSRPEARHLIRVLRRSPGDPVLLSPAAGGLFHGQIGEVREEDGELCVVVRVGAPADPPGFPPLPWSVGLSLVKGESFDLALRMAAETGIERVVPILTERAVVRWSGPSVKEARWERILREASKQCGREFPVVLEAVRRLDDLLAEMPRGGLPGAPSPAKRILVPGGPFRLEGLRPDSASLPPAIFLIGPEGGFSPPEARRAVEAGYEPLGFRTPVLRTPTAVAFVGALGVALAGLRAEGEEKRPVEEA